MGKKMDEAIKKYQEIQEKNLMKPLKNIKRYRKKILLAAARNILKDSIAVGN